ncbi:MAG: D-amino acid dehydrogenase [Rhizobiales bacterium]|nr:D-amino acid dehydrogenase [Hyphomicrobiales bacterium]
MKVVVVGGGVIGLCTAYFLIEQGHDVVLVEQERDIGRRTSLGNGSQLSYSYVAPLASPAVFAELPSLLLHRNAPVRVRPQLDIHQWRWFFSFLRACSREQSRLTTKRLLTLSFYSRQLVQEAARKESLNFAYRQTGKLVIYSSQESWQSALRQLEYQRSLGCEQQALDAEECCKQDPSLRDIKEQLAGGIFTPSEETADCYLLCLELKRVLAANPRFTLLASTQVKRLRSLGNRIIGLETAQGVIDGDSYVLAAGIESRALALPVGIDLPIYPLRGYSVTLPLASPDDGPRLSITDYRNKIVYAPLDGALRVAGFVEIGGDDRGIAEDRIETLLDAVRKTFPRITDFSRVQPWCGLRPATPRGTPLVGPTGYSNFFLNVGHGGLGFTLAMGSGRVVADFVSGREPQISLDGMLLPGAAKARADDSVAENKPQSILQTGLQS